MWINTVLNIVIREPVTEDCNTVLQHLVLFTVTGKTTVIHKIISTSTTFLSIMLAHFHNKSHNLFWLIMSLSNFRSIYSCFQYSHSPKIISILPDESVLTA